MADVLIGLASAARILNFSVTGLRHRILVKHMIPVVRRAPLRLRLSDVMAARETFPGRYTGRPRDLDTAVQKLERSAARLID
jgi:hypothetical protein